MIYFGLSVLVLFLNIPHALVATTAGLAVCTEQPLYNGNGFGHSCHSIFIVAEVGEEPELKPQASSSIPTPLILIRQFRLRQALQQARR
jgi:hypothetical protein